MGNAIDRITIHGFKSIERLDSFPLSRLNVLIGANGAGKSNFVDFFRMLRALADESFQPFVRNAGVGDGFFYLGPKFTPMILGELEFGDNAYKFELAPTQSGTIQITREEAGYGGQFSLLRKGTLESALRENKDAMSKLFGSKGDYGVLHYVYQSVSSWTVYHFHDTSGLASMRRDHSVRDWERLRHDASNIAPYLMRLQSEELGSYELIRDTVRLIAPFFDDFILRPQSANGTEDLVRLEWRQKGSDFPFQPNQLSDGTMRFICLTTTLSQPDPPATIIIDEPELGLHPYAISILADLIKSASERTQVIVSTQSPTLVDYFTPEEIVVVNRQQASSKFERLDTNSLSESLLGWNGLKELVPIERIQTKKGPLECQAGPFNREKRAWGM